MLREGIERFRYIRVWSGVMEYCQGFIMYAGLRDIVEGRNRDNHEDGVYRIL